MAHAHTRSPTKTSEACPTLSFLLTFVVPLLSLLRKTPSTYQILTMLFPTLRFVDSRQTFS